MQFESRNPADGTLLQLVNGCADSELENLLQRTQRACAPWTSIRGTQRAAKLQDLKQVITSRREHIAKLITMEMGKLWRESCAEVDKCITACDYYQDNSEAYLKSQDIVTDADHSFVMYQPLGTVLAIMPWNFPLWQVMRCALPAITAGNTCLLKHAANVPQLALAVEELFRDAGYPDGVFTTLMITSDRVADVIRDPRVHAVSFTGSEAVGRQVAACAGAALKKCVLELGGSDPFVVLEDADLSQAVQVALTSRYLNCGQSCIAAKRFIVLAAVADEFVTRFHHAITALRPGDPMLPETTLAPMARDDLREHLHSQVQASVGHGAVALAGGHKLEGNGYFYAPTLLDQVTPDNPAAQQEVFGPAAVVLRVPTEANALALANNTPYGLGASVWTRDTAKAMHWAQHLQSGMTFINGLVKSDARLPFGGIKNSGYGRELAHYGQLEFVNIKTVWHRH